MSFILSIFILRNPDRDLGLKAQTFISDKSKNGKSNKRD